MVMTERYGVPSTKIIALMKYLQTPLQQIQEGDKILVMTDDAMDPLVWQSFMAVVKRRLARFVLVPQAALSLLRSPSRRHRSGQSLQRRGGSDNDLHE